MIYKIEYHSMQSDHIMATPTLHHEEYVEVKTLKVLYEYIEEMRDDCGDLYERSLKRHFGFDFISRRGGVKIYSIKTYS